MSGSESVEAGAGVACGRSARLSVLRQAQLVAGGMALAGFVLGTLVSPGWHALSGVVGLGLIHAGLSGSCGMALLLARLPWNRAAAA
jgi:hypothetical protein